MYKVISEEKQIDITAEMIGSDALDLVKINDNTYHLIDNGRSFQLELISFQEESKEITVRINGKISRLKVKDKFDILLEKMGFNSAASAKIGDLKAPMPGLVLKLIAQEGQTVKKGDPLLILEAMKMENVIKCPADGLVLKIKVSKGQNVEKNQVLIQFA
jgi:biotin carboxyl carrier protein